MNMNKVGYAMWIGMLAVCSCKKEVPAPAAPVTSYRTYDMNIQRVQALPQGGYVLQGIDANATGDFEYAQFMNPDGDLMQRIDYSTLPDTVDGNFYGVVYITDLIPWGNDQYIVLGLGYILPNGFSLLVYQVDGQGHQVAAPYARFISGNEVALNPQVFLDPLRLEKAFGVKLANGDLAVAVNWSNESESGGYLRVYRFPYPGSPNTEAVMTTPTTYGPDELYGIQASGASDDHVVLVSTSLIEQRIRVKELGFDATSINVVHSAVLSPGPGYWRPYALSMSNGLAALSGCKIAGDQIRPFITSFSTINDAEVNGNFHLLTSVGEIGSPTQSYCGTWWNGSWAMLVDLYPPPPLTQAPYFPNDTQSDLGLILVSPTTGAVLFNQTLVPGQGMRGIGLFNDGGHLVCIGTQYGYENVGVHHTFFMKLKDPG